MKGHFDVFTCEHRHYVVKAKSKKDAKKIIAEDADLYPKDDRITFTEWGDFEIVDTD